MKWKKNHKQRKEKKNTKWIEKSKNEDKESIFVNIYVDK